MKRASLFLVLTALALICSVPASATIWTLSDQNSSVHINDASQAGSYDWVVDGDNVLYQQWFWYRVGNNPEHSVDTLPLISATPSAGNTVLDLLYGNASFTIEVRYSLRGAAAGTRSSDIGEQITITNLTHSNLDFHFFQYSDFDLGLLDQDTVTIDPGLRLVQQQPLLGGPSLSETVLSPKPNRAEAALYGTTLAKLNDGVASNLNNNLVAVGDVTWAFQWDKVLTGSGPGKTLQISKDKLIGPAVPEPASILLFGTCVVLLARRFSRKAWA